MSLAELLSDTQGLSPFSGEVDTKLRFVSERLLANTITGPATVATLNSHIAVIGSHVGMTANANPRSNTATEILPEAKLRANASASTSLGDLEFNLGLRVNDQRRADELLPRPSENANVRLDDLNVALNSNTMGKLTWGYQANLFGGVAEKCGVMPGLGAVGSAHKPQFKYTAPSFGGLELEIALSQQNRSVTSGTIVTHDEDELLTAVTTKLGTEARITYDLGSMLSAYGANAKVGVEFLAQNTDEDVINAANDVLKDIEGSGYFLDVDVSGVNVCLNRQKTKGLGPIYQHLGGYNTTADEDGAETGRRHYKHTNATVGYTIPMAYPVDLTFNYGKSERDGTPQTGASAGIAGENKRAGLSLGSNVSDDLKFSLSYDKFDSKSGLKAATKVSEAKVYAFAGHYKF